MPKRLEAFLHKRLNYDWIDVDGVSSKNHFLLMYNLKTIRENTRDKRDTLDSLRTLQRGWTRLENLNELKNLTEADTKDFLEHFSKEYKKLLQKIVPTFALRKLESFHLETTEDALIWLDLFSDNALERIAITEKILKSWQQKQYRKTSGKTQKNFNLSEATISTLKKLANEYGLSETDVITILINAELKDNIYINKFLVRANARQLAMENE